jgi:hypothetical protein
MENFNNLKFILNVSIFLKHFFVLSVLDLSWSLTTLGTTINTHNAVHAEYFSAECRYTGCHYTECHNDECYCTECYYAECHNFECSVALC